jgi:toxin-antitoxin system, antitoxin component, PHD family
MIKDVTMINIRPVSNLRNKFSEIEEEIATTNSPIILTNSEYETMSIGRSSYLTDSVERRLDIADKYAEESKVRRSTDEVFNRIRGRIGAL